MNKPNPMMTPTTVRTARTIDPEQLPWIPIGPGKAYKPLRFLAGDRGRVLLLRLDPGAGFPRHRHSGEVHAWNLCGSRRIDSGEIIGPGEYVYEPAGNVDAWEAIGDQTLIVQVVAYGTVEYLDDQGGVIERHSATSMAEGYRRHCAANGLEVLDVFE